MKPGRDRPLVIKVGGSELAGDGVDTLVQQIGRLAEQRPCVVVHGGGPEINHLLDRLEIAPRYHQGQRVTDEATLEAVEMALSGKANKDLTQRFLASGVDALGLSGVDRRLLTVEPWEEDMGRVGRVVDVRVEVLHDLFDVGVVPVVSPISLGPGGRYNVNADHAAAAIARALRAASLIFVTNVPGVRVDGEIVPRLTAAETFALIDDGVIRDGMIPKVRAGLEALDGGVAAISITDRNGLADRLAELGGTRFTATGKAPGEAP